MRNAFLKRVQYILLRVINTLDFPKHVMEWDTICIVISPLSSILMTGELNMKLLCQGIRTQIPGKNPLWMKFKIEFLFDNGAVNKKVQLAKIIVTFWKGFDFVAVCLQDCSFFWKAFLRVMNLTKSGESFDHEDHFHSSLSVLTFEMFFWLEI